MTLYLLTIKDMKLHYTSAMTTTDKKTSGRRFRNIIANSGLTMESGEARDLNSLFVMGRDGKLIRIADLATDPDKQTQKYKVNFATDHGHYDTEIGDQVVDVEDIIGDAKVWMKDGELYARVYFAEDDAKADHAFAISENASYSIGTEWYEDGYYGADNEIDGFVGILREISMVDTGNDPRAQTIDHKPADSKVHRDDEAGDGDNKSNERNKSMDPESKKDELTPDEAKALKETLAEVVDKFTTDVPESETEPTARESKDSEGDEAEETPAEETKDVKHSPVVIIRTNDKVKQEKSTTTKDWLHSKAGHVAFADTLRKAGRFDGSFATMWRAEVSKHMSLDGITGLPNPAPVEQYFAEAVEKSTGIISHFKTIPAKSFRAHVLVPTSDDNGRARGHQKGKDKKNQEMKDLYRDLLVKMVYKRLDLDATELYENPQLIDFRSRELVEAIIVEIERAAMIGDGRVDDTTINAKDAATRGFWSIVADAKENSEKIGKYLATTYEAAEGDNLYDNITHARGKIRATGAQFLVVKSQVLTDLLTDKDNGHYLIQPGTKAEDLLNVSAIYTPTWMDSCEDADAILVADNAYGMIGETGVTSRPDFDTVKNTDILLAETPRGGSLTEYMAAVVIKPHSEAV